jgi:GTPase involved in cell partitioning and DNA repair
MFIDYAQIEVSSGNGGDGAVTFAEKNMFLRRTFRWKWWKRW